MTKTTQFWLVAGVGVYMLAMLGIGWWTSKKIKGTADYIVAGSRLGWWLSIGTIFATWFGAETCMGSSRTAYEKGFLGIIADPFGAGLCLILAGVLFAQFFHLYPRSERPLDWLNYLQAWIIVGLGSLPGQDCFNGWWRRARPGWPGGVPSGPAGCMCWWG